LGRIKFNRNQHGLGYEKDIKFHIPNYSKPIQFVSVNFLSTLRTLSIQKFLKNANIVIELVTWRINVLISILVFIVGRQIIFQKNVKRRRRFRKKHFTMVGLALGDGHLAAKILHKSYHRVQTQVKTYLNGEVAKANGFECLQSIVTDDDFGHDWGPILNVFLN
jgi:hypothetical protein